MLTKEEIQVSESYILGILLALVGGFLDAYSYLFRGHVFANAQTGNIVLLGVKLEEHNIKEALFYFLPICAFIVGVFVVELLKCKYKEAKKIHWRQGVVGIEIIILFVVGCLKPGTYDMAANIMISFVCAMQVQSFRKVQGHPFASTMCTGNLRSGTEALFHFIKNKNKEAGERAFRYYGIIFVFILGAVLGSFILSFMGQYSIFICCGILLVVCGMMFYESF